MLVVLELMVLMGLVKFFDVASVAGNSRTPIDCVLLLLLLATVGVMHEIVPVMLLLLLLMLRRVVRLMVVQLMVLLVLHLVLLLETVSAVLALLLVETVLAKIQVRYAVHAVLIVERAANQRSRRTLVIVYRRGAGTVVAAVRRFRSGRAARCRRCRRCRCGRRQFVLLLGVAGRAVVLNVNSDDEDDVQDNHQTTQDGEQRHVQCEPVWRLAVCQLTLQLVVGVAVGGRIRRRLVRLQRVGGGHRVSLVRLRALDVMGGSDGGDDGRIWGAF